MIRKTIIGILLILISVQLSALTREQMTPENVFERTEYFGKEKREKLPVRLWPLFELEDHDKYYALTVLWPVFAYESNLYLRERGYENSRYRLLILFAKTDTPVYSSNMLLPFWYTRSYNYESLNSDRYDNFSYIFPYITFSSYSEGDRFYNQDHGCEQSYHHDTNILFLFGRESECNDSGFTQRYMAFLGLWQWQKSPSQKEFRLLPFFWSQKEKYDQISRESLFIFPFFYFSDYIHPEHKESSMLIGTFYKSHSQYQNSQESFHTLLPLYIRDNNTDGSSDTYVLPVFYFSSADEQSKVKPYTRVVAFPLLWMYFADDDYSAAFYPFFSASFYQKTTYLENNGSLNTEPSEPGIEDNTGNEHSFGELENTYEKRRHFSLLTILYRNDYRLIKNDAGSREYSSRQVLYPLMAFKTDPEEDHIRVFPFYWFTYSKIDASQFLLIPPFYIDYQDKQKDYELYFPFYGKEHIYNESKFRFFMGPLLVHRLKYNEKSSRWDFPWPLFSKETYFIDDERKNVFSTEYLFIPFLWSYNEPTESNLFILGLYYDFIEYSALKTEQKGTDKNQPQMKSRFFLFIPFYLAQFDANTQRKAVVFPLYYSYDYSDTYGIPTDPGYYHKTESKTSFLWPLIASTQEKSVHETGTSTGDYLYFLPFYYNESHEYFSRTVKQLTRLQTENSAIDDGPGIPENENGENDEDNKTITELTPGPQRIVTQVKTGESNTTAIIPLGVSYSRQSYDAGYKSSEKLNWWLLWFDYEDDSETARFTSGAVEAAEYIGSQRKINSAFSIYPFYTSISETGVYYDTGGEKVRQQSDYFFQKGFIWPLFIMTSEKDVDYVVENLWLPVYISGYETRSNNSELNYEWRFFAPLLGGSSTVSNNYHRSEVFWLWPFGKREKVTSATDTSVEYDFVWPLIGWRSSLQAANREKIEYSQFRFLPVFWYSNETDYTRSIVNTDHWMLPLYYYGHDRQGEAYDTMFLSLPFYYFSENESKSWGLLAFLANYKYDKYYENASEYSDFRIVWYLFRNLHKDSFHLHQILGGWIYSFESETRANYDYRYFALFKFLYQYERTNNEAEHTFLGLISF